MSAFSGSIRRFCRCMGRNLCVPAQNAEKEIYYWSARNPGGPGGMRDDIFLLFIICVWECWKMLRCILIKVIISSEDVERRGQ